MAKHKKGGIVGLFLILFGVALVAFVVCVAILMLSPNVSILGISYKTITNQTTTITRINGELLEVGNFDEIRIETSGRQVEFVADSFGGNAHISVQDKMNYSGFYKRNDQDKSMFKLVVEKKTSQSVFSEFDENGTNKILFVTVNIPAGLAFKNDGRLIVHVPDYFDKAVSITSNGGSVEVGKYYSNEPTKKFNINNLTINSGGGQVDIGSLVTVHKSLKVETSTGNVNYLANEKDVARFEIKSSNGKFSSSKDAIKATEFALGGDNIQIALSTTLDGSVNLDDADGRISLSKVTKSVYCSADKPCRAELKIKEIGESLNLSKAHCDFVEIDKVGGSAFVCNDGGDVKISSANGDVNITTTHSKIILKNANGIINLSTKSGEMSLENVGGQLNIVATERANINAKIDSLSNASNITTKGKINVKLQAGLAFMFSTNKNNQSFQYGGLVSAPPESGFAFMANTTTIVSTSLVLNGEEGVALEQK